MKKTKAAKAPKVKAPACSKWNMWLGKEIEGTSDIGVRTLFVRKATNDEVLNRPFLGSDDLKRVWLCKEFLALRNTKLALFLKKLEKKGVTIAAEVTDSLVSVLSKSDLRAIRRHCTVYYKTALTFPLTNKDFICAGSPYSDEAFAVGSGAKVAPKQYAADIRIS